MKNYEKRLNLGRYSLIKTLNHLNHPKSNDKSNSNRIGNKNMLKTPYSVKPVFCVIPRDLNIKDIFIQLTDSTFTLYNDNKTYIKLSQEQIVKRKYIIESIKRFIINHRIKYKILYNIIYMFDILICYNDKNKLISSLEKLGLGSTILMIKFIYEEFLMIPLNKFQTLYENNKYTINELQEIEITCLKLIDYYMNFPTPLSFMELLLLNGVVFSTDNIKNESSHKIYNMILIILEEIMIKSNEYIKYNPLYLTCCIVAYCREYYELEKWPKILSRVFDVNQLYFDDIYDEFFSPYFHHYKKYYIINDRFLNKNSDKKDCYKNNQEKNNNDVNINYINKDSNLNKENSEEKEIDHPYKYTNSNINILRANYNNFNIKVNYKTSQEIRNSAFFRKMNEKYAKHNIKNMNKSDNLSIKNIKNVETSKNIEENKNNNINYDLIPQTNKYSTINSSKKALINIYNTPIKFNDNPSCYNKPNKKAIEYNVHQRNSANILISINNDSTNENNESKPRLFNDDKINNKCNDSNLTNNIIDTINKNDYQSITVNQREINKFMKKCSNKTIGDIKLNTNSNEKDEIKVRIKEIHYISNNNRELQKQKIYSENKFISTESNYNKKNNKNYFNKKKFNSTNSSKNKNNNNNENKINITNNNNFSNLENNINHTQNNFFRNNSIEKSVEIFLNGKDSFFIHNNNINNYYYKKNNYSHLNTFNNNNKHFNNKNFTDGNLSNNNNNIYKKINLKKNQIKIPFPSSNKNNKNNNKNLFQYELIEYFNNNNNKKSKLNKKIKNNRYSFNNFDLFKRNKILTNRSISHKSYRSNKSELTKSNIFNKLYNSNENKNLRNKNNNILSFNSEDLKCKFCINDYNYKNNNFNNKKHKNYGEYLYEKGMKEKKEKMKNINNIINNKKYKKKLINKKNIFNFNNNNNDNFKYKINKIKKDLEKKYFQIQSKNNIKQIKKNFSITQPQSQNKRKINSNSKRKNSKEKLKINIFNYKNNSSNNINNNSNSNFNRTKIFEKIFINLDSDFDNKITYNNFSLKLIPINIQKIIEPLLNELIEFKASMTKKEFLFNMEQLFNELDFNEKKILLDYLFYKKKRK